MKTFYLSIKSILLTAFVLVSLSASGQFYEEYPFPHDRFISPLGIEWRLSGTFGEPRGNHFHAGTDIKTNGTTGFNLYAIDDGYVSRIKVSPFGYGKAIYIDHYDGYTSVYGHMSSFNEQIDSLVEARQYANKEFAQDINLGYNELQVKQGEVIGLSGNSGGSAGPHLHFEIRESSTQMPLNPLMFGYQVKDTKKPQLMGVKLTSFGNSYYDHVGSANEQYVAMDNVKDTLEIASGRIGIAVHGLDQQDLANNRNGVFRVELFVDGASHFQWSMDKMSFDEGRYVNAFRDFYERKQNRTIYNCYRLPGNHLGLYEYMVDDGYVKLEQGSSKQIKIDVWDFHQNKSTVSFAIKGSAINNQSAEMDLKEGVEILKVPYDQNFNFSNDAFKIYVPAGTFYDHIALKYSVKSNASSNIYSDEHQLHDYLVPMHKSAVVQVKAIDFPKGLESKAVMVHRDLQGVEQTFTTFWKDGMVSAKTREVGYFYVKVDETKPEIKWLNYNSKTKTFRGDQIRVKISDDLSGITDYNGYIDGEWVVFDYDAKRNLLTYDYDKRCPPGEHKLKIVVSDKVNNTVVREIDFTAL